MSRAAEAREPTGTDHSTKRRLMARRLWWCLPGMVVVTLASSLAVFAVYPGAHGNAFLWPVVTVAIVAVQRLRVPLHLGRATQDVTLVGVPIVVGAVLLTSHQLIVATALGMFASFLLERLKVVLALANTVTTVVATCALLGILSLVMPEPVPSATSWLSAPSGWLALALALICLVAVISLGDLVILAVIGFRPTSTHLKQLGVQMLLIPSIDFALVVVAVACYGSQPWALLALVGPALAFGLWYGRSERMRARFKDLQSLYSFSKSLADTTERTDILVVALRETASVLHCQRAELVMAETEGLVRYRLEGPRSIVEEVVEEEGLEGEVLESQRPVLMAHSSRDEYLAERGLKDAMMVPIAVGGARSGLLVVADRDGEGSNTFTQEDQDFLQALGAHLSTALTASNHLDHLRRSVAEREHQAYHDNLTGLANRTLFMNVVAAALENSGGNRLVAVVLMDLDGFKEINDALGHHTGDEVLKVVAQRVSSGVREYGMAARLGGDEFAFMIGSAESVDEVIAITEQVMGIVGQPMEIQHVNLTVRASIGIALAPVHGLDAASMLKKADVAMYSAKSSSRRVNVYERSMDNSSSRRLALATDLGKAIESDELDLWFQPVADIGTGRVSGFEALLRWPHPALGYIPPDEFIPIAEQTGLIEPLTWWVVNVALGELRKWRDDGYEFDMAVNVSVRSLMDAAIIDRLRDMVASFDLSPNNITLEITESSMMVELERAESVLRRLSDLGFKIAIDDFGTGYSSLSRLKVLPVHVVKIDKAFIQNICFDKGDQAIVKAIIDLARVMGHEIVAEGIEDLQTWSRLASLGCDLGQGYYFAKPMLARECRRWVLDRQGPSVASVRPLGIRRIEGA